MQNIFIIIPARLDSSRLPKKALKDIEGIPMIIRTYNQALKSGFKNILIATCGDEIANVCKDHNAAYVITDKALASGTDRIYQAYLSHKEFDENDIIINLQGDLPLCDPSYLEDILEPLKQDKTVQMATLASVITDPLEVNTQSVVKVAIDHLDKNSIGRAIYFSRHAIPANAKTLYHHIGIYAYRANALKAFCSYKQSDLERCEKLEQLRFLSNGHKIGIKIVKNPPIAVDVYEDLEKVRNIVKLSK